MDEHTQRCLDLHFDQEVIREVLREVARLAIDAQGQDGAHHCRWLAQEIVRIIQASEVITREPGIVP